MISIIEMSSGNYYPVYMEKGMGGGGSSSEVGTSAVSKTLFITFELK